jgi:rhodanese-related sulfurtransferase
MSVILDIVFSNVNHERARELIAKGVEIIDVRDPAEWAKGHLPGARLVSLATLRTAPLSHLPKAGVLFVCAGGVRSQTAARLAVEYGVTRVYSLIGGTNSWVRAGLPLANPIRVAV